MKIGTTDIVDCKIGTTQVNKVYLGNNLVWEKLAPEVYSLYYDTNGLVINTTNSFGIVDALGNVSSFVSTSPASNNDELTQGVLASQPNLIVDHFGVGKNAILFDNVVNSTYLIKTDTTFTPDWDDEFWIAGKFKSSGGASRVMTTIGEGAIGNKMFRTQFDPTNKFQFAIGTQNNSVKVIKTTVSYNDNLEHDYILHWKGTDNIADAKIYIDGVLSTVTTTSTGSFVGSSIYSGLLGINLYFGARQDVAISVGWNQYLGKHIYGLGEPNVEAIFNSLNSAI